MKLGDLVNKKPQSLKEMSEEMFKDIQVYAKETGAFLNVHPRMFVAGGFAVNLYANSSNKRSKYLNTKDIDFSVYIENDNEINTVEDHLLNIIQDFSQKFGYKYKDFKISKSLFIKPIIQDKYRGISNIKWVRITYKNHEFMDIMFSKYRRVDKLSKNISQQTGFPLRTIDFYIEDISILYVKEVLKGVNDFAFKKRNPFEGNFKLKGKKDFYRLKFLCSLSKNKKYCKFAEKLKHNKNNDTETLLNIYVMIRSKYNKLPN